MLLLNMIINMIINMNTNIKELFANMCLMYFLTSLKTGFSRLFIHENTPDIQISLLITDNA